MGIRYEYIIKQLISMSRYNDQIIKDRQQRKSQAVQNAINTWKGYRAGNIAPGESVPYDPDHCDQQIAYFKAL